ncbi:type VI secretion system ImpA family N-terminal domain-containing protein, partial [Escherichia coli]
MDKNFILNLSINTTNPKNNKEFLWLSYSMNNLSSVKYERPYWMTLEKRCLSLFMENGYDLQTGVWFCLISTHLYGWEGLAISSWKFADSFVKQKKCWPPVTDAHIRTKILLWYIKNIVPMIQSLPNDEQTYSSLTLLEDSLILLAELEYNLLSGERTIISEMLHEVKRQKNGNYEKSDDYFMEESRHEGLNETSGHVCYNSTQRYKKTCIYYNIIAFISGALVTIFINYLGKPQTALKIRSIMPDSFLSEIVMNYSGCSEYTPDSTDYWTKLSKKIDGFAEELNTIENNGGYITISRLKTIAYDMKKNFLEYDTPVNVRMSNLYNNVYIDKKDIKRELEIIEYNVNKFNC